MFNRAGGDSYDAMDAKVMVVSARGWFAPSTWLRSTPSPEIPGRNGVRFVHRYKGKGVMWLSFSSRRPCGVRGGTTAQIWMVPVEINALDKGMDAGYPPIRLPFQSWPPAITSRSGLKWWIARHAVRSICPAAALASAAPTDTASRSSINPRGLCCRMEIRHPVGCGRFCCCSLFALGAVARRWRFQVLRTI